MTATETQTATDRPVSHSSCAYSPAGRQDSVCMLPSELTCRWGVMLGQAVQLTPDGKGKPTVFEMSLGQIDRGAHVSWLSQRPRFPPLLSRSLIFSRLFRAR
eukprot:2786093-Rhodomonas_salina.1